MKRRGRWGTIASDRTVRFGTEFKITSASFPPVFAGTLPANRDNGHYHPVYPPFDVSLTWWYPEWPAEDTTFNSYRDHVGEYNGAWSDGAYVFTTWTDYRLVGSHTLYPRNQSDIRLVRLAWPQ
jgi:hypothetical protein